MISSDRGLSVVDAPTTAGEVAGFLPQLAAALAGTGPALLPVPGTGIEREQVLVAAGAHAPVGDAALLVPTSGSTGTPRVAALSGAALSASADATHHVLGGPGRWLLALPTTHIAGLQVLVRSVRSGLDPGVVDLSHGFTAAAFARAVADLDVAAAELPHYTALVPTQLQRLLDDGDGVEALWQLDAVLIGGAALNPKLFDQAHDAGVTVVRTYGMTETCGGCVYDGVPLPGVTVSLTSDGVVQVAGSVLFDGYRDAGESGLADGVFTTSDMGHWDTSGALVVDGRVDNVVNSGGVKVPAEAVEQAMAGAGLGDAIVIGVPDDEWGERVVAVVARSGAAPTTAEVRDALRSQVPDSWLPRQVEPIAHLPLLASGKPNRAGVRRWFDDLAR